MAKDGIVDRLTDIATEALRTGAEAAATVVMARGAEAVSEATKPAPNKTRRFTKKAQKKGGAKAAKKRAAKKKTAKKKSAKKSKKKRI